MSVDTDLAIMRPAATEAAALLTSTLGLTSEPGEAFDLWPENSEGILDLGGEALSKGAKAWSAPLIGPLGPCGEIALSLPPGAKVPGEGRIAAALASTTPALGAACGADHIGDMQRPNPDMLLTPRPGFQALAVPLLAGDVQEGLFVVITGVGQVAAELPHLDPAPGLSAGRSIANLGEVEMTVSVELGRTKIPIKDLLNIHNGSVVQLDRPVSHPVDIFVHGTLIARGEVVVVDECFAVRVTELLTGD
ncbi:MAG: flagellar motor switch protein FliN [Acidimicrobiales bacterium]